MSAIRCFVERRLPALVAVPVAVLAWQHPIPIPAAYLPDVLGSSLTMAVVFLGFLATSLSILITSSGSGLIRQLKKAKKLHPLVGYLRASIAWSLLWLVVSFILYFAQPRWLLTLWAVLASLALISYLRVVGLMAKLAVE